MPLTRLTSTLAAATLGAVLVATTYGAQAAKAPAAPTHPAHVRLAGHARFVAPAPHKFRPGSTLRMGLHCDSTDMSM